MTDKMALMGEPFLIKIRPISLSLREEFLFNAVSKAVHFSGVVLELIGYVC